MSERRRKSSTKNTAWTEFDCPECTAHNPWDEGFQDGDRVLCNWCGLSFRVRVVKTEDGPKAKLEED